MTPQSLTDLLMAQLQHAEASQIVDRAVNIEKLTGNELHMSLFMSGVTNGIESTQKFTSNALSGHITVMRQSLQAIDTQIEKAAGNDEMIEFVNALRTPIAAAIRQHLDILLTIFAQDMEALTGLDRKHFLSDMPVSSMGATGHLNAGMTMTLRNPGGFAGFLLTPDTKSMKCRCANCFERIASHSPRNAEDTVPLAVSRFGSMDAALRAYAVEILDYCTIQRDKVVTEYGSLDMPESAAASLTNAYLAKLGGLSVPGQGTSHE